MTYSYKHFKTAVMATAGIAALSIASVASAQDAPTPAHDSAASADQTMNPEAIVVTATRRVAGGLMKLQTAPEAMSSVTASAIQEKASVASPLQLIATVPGVNFGSSDAYGLSVRNFMSVRGLDQTEIGFLVENIPGVDLQNYYPFSESWADNENISDITLTPGNSRLQDPIINASGGELIMSIRDPRDHLGGTVSGSVGSYDGWRVFGDVDTGELGQSGLKAFASFSRTRAENFVGRSPKRYGMTAALPRPAISILTRCASFFASTDRVGRIIAGCSTR